MTAVNSGENSAGGIVPAAAVLLAAVAYAALAFPGHAEILAVVLLASLVRSVFGFGDALVGMPLLALFIPMTSATPLLALVGPTLGAILLVRGWKHLDLKNTSALIVGTLAGIPIGLLFLKSMDNRFVSLALGLLIILFSFTGLLRPGRLRLKTGKSAPAFGLAGGILGAAYNTNGPPIALYGALRGWSPDEFRANLQGYFLPTGLAIMVGQGAAGLWSGSVFRFFLESLPIMIAAVWAGERIGRKIPAAKFMLWVYGLVFLAGAALLLKTLGLFG
ncbi:MAG: sulfite exporter TauE/SafE family protein [Candidatus Aminicenantes bacterium]|nr:sulfite exporter TauE/SafE family protein [Candidatus Aminicenantes bacterium]